MNSDDAPKKRGPKSSVWAEGGNYKNGRIKNADAKEAYVAWLVTPPAEREPKTKAALAEELGVTRTTLMNWQRQPEVADRVHQGALQLLKVERTSSVLDELYKVATDASRGAQQVQAGKALLEHTRWLMSRIDESALDLDTLPDSELRKLADRLYDRIEGTEADQTAS
jgi:hypothetical protein